MLTGQEDRILTLQQRIEAFAKLGDYLRAPSEELAAAMERAHAQNAWYTPENIAQAIHAWGAVLTRDKLNIWLQPYEFAQLSDRSVGVILAGNIPLVGWHDILCVLVAGLRVQIKLSSVDVHLTRHLLVKLIEIEPAFGSRISEVERLQNFDFVIATGSNNSSRYFEHYFGGKPHIIRKNRNSVAVLDGNETPEELQSLGHDIFDYFGLGCRNVSKVFFPKGYSVSDLFQGIESFQSVIQHHKYANNYDYNKSIYLINGDDHFDNGFLLLKPDTRIASPLSVVYYEEYSDKETLMASLNAVSDQLQCVVSRLDFSLSTPVFQLGYSQQPELDDYADGLNTLDFLKQYR